MLVALPTALILLQPDLGSAAVVVAIGAVVVTRRPACRAGGWSAPCSSGLAVVVVALTTPVLSDYQRDRLTAFADPSADPQGSGYQTRMVRLAIGAGGVWGQGFMRGERTQGGFVPYQLNDFVFSVAGEELGFVGATGLLLLLAFVVGRVLVVAAPRAGRVRPAGRRRRRHLAGGAGGAERRHEPRGCCPSPGCRCRSCRTEAPRCSCRRGLAIGAGRRDARHVGASLTGRTLAPPTVGHDSRTHAPQLTRTTIDAHPPPRRSTRPPTNRSTSPCWTGRHQSVGHMFRDRDLRASPDRPAYLHALVTDGGDELGHRRPGPSPTSWSARSGAGLIALGIEPEDRVAIASSTRFEWILADLAVMLRRRRHDHHLPDDDGRRRRRSSSPTPAASVVFAENADAAREAARHARRDPRACSRSSSSTACPTPTTGCITLDELRQLGREYLHGDPDASTRGSTPSSTTSSPRSSTPRARPAAPRACGCRTAPGSTRARPSRRSTSSARTTCSTSGCRSRTSSARCCSPCRCRSASPPPSTAGSTRSSTTSPS